jgi:hypothetical protein
MRQRPQIRRDRRRRSRPLPALRHHDAAGYTAAGQAILEAAGGRVETLTGTPLRYGKPGLKNDGFLASGRRA